MRHDPTWRALGLYRDPSRGKLAGVCAGLADHAGCSAAVIRILAIIALLWLSPLTLIAYLILAVVLPVKPGLDFDHDGENCWRSARSSSGQAFRDRGRRFEELDTKLQPMEGYVTSHRHELERQFRDLEL
jgi:phage shock protein C